MCRLCFTLEKKHFLFCEGTIRRWCVYDVINHIPTIGQKVILGFEDGALLAKFGEMIMNEINDSRCKCSIR